MVSNVWRIGQQHFVLNKMYEEEHGRGQAAARRRLTADGYHSTRTASGSSEAPGPANGVAGTPSPNAARRKKKKRKR